MDEKVISGLAEATKSYKKEDPILENIYNKYPALKKMGKVALKQDTKFTRDITGAGSIEYFSPTQDTITYDNGYKYGHPSKGQHGIVYNPNFNTEQDIALDMLHGMGVDKNYDKYKNDLIKAVSNSKFNGDLIGQWNEYNTQTKGENDGFNSFKNNWIDGMIRNLLFEGTDKDFEKKNYWKDARKVYLSEKDINSSFSKIESYLKTGK